MRTAKLMDYRSRWLDFVVVGEMTMTMMTMMIDLRVGYRRIVLMVVSMLFQDLGLGFFPVRRCVFLVLLLRHGPVV